MNINSIASASENVQAIYDVWFVGDQFFREVFPTLQSLKRRAKVQKINPPYLYEYYNIFGYYSLMSSANKRCIAHLFNAIVTGLNTRQRLPHLIVIMIDKDIIEDVGIFDHLAEDIIAKNIGWLFKQIEIMIRCRRMELSDKKPGVVYSNDPRVVLVDMIPRPHVFPQNSIMQGVMSMQQKFNSVLSDAADHFGFHRLYIECCSSEYQFDRMGNLNVQGQEDMWKEINALLEKFDFKKIQLKLKVNDRVKQDYLNRKM